MCGAFYLDYFVEIKGNNMFFLYKILFVYSLLFSMSDGDDHVYIKEKCSVKDEKCLASLFQNIVTHIPANGVPEIDMPPLDPLELKNVSLTLLDSITINLVNGVHTGISKCIYNDYHIDLDNRIIWQDIICNLTIKGDLKLSGRSPEIEAELRTASVNAHGRGELKLDKFRLKFGSSFVVFKKDGDVYIKLYGKPVKYEFDIQKASFFADKIFIGKQDISRIGVSLLNNNWREIMKTYGNVFIETAFPIYYFLANKFYIGVPLKKYIIEDLSSYVEN